MTYSKLITIAATHDTPLIQIDRSNADFCIKGNAFPDDPMQVFTVINGYLNEAIEREKDIYLELEMLYMNTGSRLMISEVITSIHERAKSYEILWLYSDSDLLDEIEYMAYYTGATINTRYRELRQ